MYPTYKINNDAFLTFLKYSTGYPGNNIQIYFMHTWGVNFIFILNLSICFNFQSSIFQLQFTQCTICMVLYMFIIHPFRDQCL